MRRVRRPDACSACASWFNFLLAYSCTLADAFFFSAAPLFFFFGRRRGQKKKISSLFADKWFGGSPRKFWPFCWKKFSKNFRDHPKTTIFFFFFPLREKKN